MKRKRIGSIGWQAMMLAILLGSVVTSNTTVANAANNYVELPGNRRVIELAICLDASQSMDGLIDAAKQKLWAIVNDLALAEPTPEFRVALLTYGNDDHSPASGWVKVEAPFTSDLDLVSQRLFAITTNGGTEYVGRVLQRGGELQWHPSADALQLIVVAGNEPADQDTEVSFRDMCRDLIGRGIMVNSIYCGPPADDIAPGWREVASLADGMFATIDQDNGTIVIATPFDDRLGQLSAELNKTYIPFGASGRAGATNQEAQDANAASMNAATKAMRAKAKSSALYQCSWDLVDACNAGDVKIADVDASDLPESMRSLSSAERQAYVDDMSAKRRAIRKQIEEVSVKHEAFVREEMKQKALDDSKAFDNVMRRAILEQAEKRGIRFKRTSQTSSVETEAGSPAGGGAGLVQTVSAPEPASPRASDFSPAEKAAIEGVFARAMAVREGNAKDDIRWLTSAKAVVPDVVVSIGTVDDWDLLNRELKPGRLKKVSEAGDMLLDVDGQTILLLNGGC